MLTLSDYAKNIDKEYDAIQLVKQSYILENYNESDLLFVETYNRMMESYIFLFNKNNKIELFVIEDMNEDIGEKFPIVNDVNIFLLRESKNYDLYEAGFGGLLCVKKSINKEFKKELYKMAKEYNVEFFNGILNVNFVHCFWITIARNIIK